MTWSYLVRVNPNPSPSPSPSPDPSPNPSPNPSPSPSPSPNPGPSPNQAALTWFYLVKRAEYLTSNLMDSCRDELLKLWEREGLVRLAGVRVRVNV